MRVEVNLVSGDVYTFELQLERDLEFLDKIRPTEIFGRPLHQFLGKLSTVSINPQSIEWIALDTLEFPSATQQAKTLTIRQLSADTFKDRVAENKAAIVASMQAEVAQNVITAYGKAVFKSGRALYLEIRGKLERADDRIKASQRIFEMPALFVYGETGGLFILNAQNIAVWQVVPGLKKSAFFSIPGELIGAAKTARAATPES